MRRLRVQAGTTHVGAPARRPRCRADRLATVLGKDADDPEVIDTLQKVAQAGSREVLDYCTGKAVPTTFSEVRSNRIN